MAINGFNGNSGARDNAVFAGIDVGSNAIRLMVKKFNQDGSTELLYKRRYPVRLGHNVFSTGMLDSGLLDKAVDLFASIRDILDSAKVTRYRAVATSAVREGKNRQELIDRINQSSGLRLEVISGTEEARLIYLAVKDKLPFASDNWIIIDLGGGSVEITHTNKAGFFTETKSYGAVRLLETTGCNLDDPKSVALLEDYIKSIRLDRHFDHAPHSGVIGTGGNIEEIGKIAQNKIESDDAITLPVTEIESIISSLKKMTVKQRQARYELRDDRADIILPAAMVYHAILRKLGDREIIIPGVGVREGIIKDIHDNYACHNEYALENERQIIQAIDGLGAKYAFDREHALFVTKMALSIFNQLRQMHPLLDDDRILLEAASMLHDIGQFISYEKHHKHSFYIISNTELPGLTKEQMNFIACIARYHRRSLPKPEHSGFSALLDADRKKLVLLSSILRLADALDSEHLQRISSVSLGFEGTYLNIGVIAGKTGLSEHLKIAKKGQMLADFFCKILAVKELGNEKE